MDKNEILEKAQNKKAVIGEMEQAKFNKSNWIAIVVAGVVAIVFMVIEGLLGHPTAIHAIGAICFTWASVFCFCQYFVAKRKYFGILLGAILEAAGALTMLVFFVLRATGVL